VQRRNFLRFTVAAGAGCFLPSAPGQNICFFLEAGRSVNVPLLFFTAEEAAIVEAATERIFPRDENGPGAKDAGVTFFIDRQLAGAWGKGERWYKLGPRQLDAGPEVGYQGTATPAEQYRTALKGLKGFAQLTPEQQDTALEGIADTRFFTMLRRNTIEGMFCDPQYGGNKGKVGWKLIGFPGPALSFFVDVDRHFGEAFRPAIHDLADLGAGGGATNAAAAPQHMAHMEHTR
jgi:gluconate 2-dehydrogenase gamma chain